MDLVVKSGDREARVRIERDGSGAPRYLLRVGDVEYTVDAVVVGRTLRSLVTAGEQHEVAVRAESDGRYAVTAAGALQLVEVVDPLTHLARQTRGARVARGPRAVTAYMPGRVVAVLVAVGDRMSPGQGMVVLEAMKMQNEIQAESEATVTQVFVSPGQAVEGGDPLFELE